MYEVAEQDYISTILAFDYGEKRIGVAIKPKEQASAEPLLTLENNQDLYKSIQELVDLHSPSLFVVGWPRNLNANLTEQTKKAEQFASELQQRYNIKVELQDEALSTEQAQSRIPARLKRKSRELIDQYAACVILEDYLQEKQD